MEVLGAILGALALVAGGVGAYSHAHILYLIAGFAAVSALTTFMSKGISRYLKIFVAIFSLETAFTGAAACLLAAGFAPDSVVAAIEETVDVNKIAMMALTTATFSILVYVISHVKVVRDMMRIADLYFLQNETGSARIWPFGSFHSREASIATAMVVFLVLINQAQVFFSLRLSFFNRDWFNAIEKKDAAEFWRQLFYVFTLWAFIYIASAVIEFVVQSMLIIRWRKWLTEHYIVAWLGGRVHYSMALAGNEADNPDQRIAEDINRFIDGGTEGYGLYSYSILLISTLSSLVTYSILLWRLSSDFTIPGTDIVAPGLLFWVALIYAVLGTAITHWIGRSLVGLYFVRQKVEADFRFSLARLREYSEQIALLRGERAEQSLLKRRFGAIIANYLDLVNRRKELMAFTQFYGQLSPIIPFVFCAPFYFAGKITLGVMTQTARSFGTVEGALTFFINYYTSLAGFKSVLDRLTSFDQSMNDAKKLQQSGPSVIRVASAQCQFDHLTLALPNGRTIVETDHATLEPNVSVLLTGPSGSGKSTLLRAMANIWPYGSGAIQLPEAAHALVLPQRPYFPNGSLRAVVSYPAEPGDYADESIREALAIVKLPYLTDQLDQVDAWSLRLSGGEQQRLAIARALLAKPDWLLLDEATAAVDEKLEAELYAAIKTYLPNTTIISVGHRSTLDALHQSRFEMVRRDDGVFVPRASNALT